jgi:OOP family OmpA-OmpF porin
MNALKSIAGAVLVSGSLAAAQAYAQEKFYVGASLGSSDIDNGIAEGLITSGTVDGKDSGTKIYGGYRFGRNLGIELAYVDLGGAGYSGDFLGTPVTGGKVNVSGFNASLVGLYPASDKLELFAKAGLFAWEAKASDTTGGVPFSDKINGTGLSLGLGANYFFTKSVGARVEWEHFELDPGSAGLLSAGIIVKF